MLKKKLPPPTQLNDAVLLIAKIGGYLGRKHDPPPGYQLLWQGYTEFQFMCLGYSLLDGNDCPDSSYRTPDPGDLRRDHFI